MNAIASRRAADQPWVNIDEGDALERAYADGTFDAAVPVQVDDYVADMPIWCVGRIEYPQPSLWCQTGTVPGELIPETDVMCAITAHGAIGRSGVDELPLEQPRAQATRDDTK
jgi:hypothetical protein